MIGLLLLSMRNERKLELTGGIALARLGPILVKNLPNPRLSNHLGIDD